MRGMTRTLKPSSLPVPRRSDLARALRISVGGFANPDVFALEHGGAKLVVKDFAPRSALVRGTLARWIARREQRAWRALAGHAAVPRWAGAIDALAFAVEHRAGRPLTRSVARETPAAFFAALAHAIDEMHARGVVHLDLRHQGNVLVGDDGAPVLVDFGSALVLPPGSALARVACALLGWIDRSAVEKWRGYATGVGASSRSSRGDSRAT
jgi:predicted Ser/Thr protein kinase